MDYGFYTALCDEWEKPDAEMVKAHSALVLKHKQCGGAVLLYYWRNKSYDEARCQKCSQSWHISVVARKQKNR